MKFSSSKNKVHRTMGTRKPDVTSFFFHSSCEAKHENAPSAHGGLGGAGAAACNLPKSRARGCMNAERLAFLQRTMRWYKNKRVQNK
jgi:hypothetical protein